MTLFDWIIVILLAFAAVDGFRHGIAAQLGGILGLILGVFLAFRFGMFVGGWFGADGTLATVIGFLVVFFAVMVILGLLGRMMHGMFRLAGLGVIDSIGGLFLGVLKAGLLLSVLLMVFEPLNEEAGWVDEAQIEQSVLYRPVRKAASVAFPYLKFAAERIPSIFDTCGDD